MPDPMPDPYPAGGVPVTPGSKHDMAAYAPPPTKDPRLDWLFKGLGILITAVVIGGGGTIIGGVYARIVANEKDNHDQDKVDVEFKSKIERLQQDTTKQWELIAKMRLEIEALKGQ